MRSGGLAVTEEDNMEKGFEVSKDLLPLVIMYWLSASSPSSVSYLCPEGKRCPSPS